MPRSVVLVPTNLRKMGDAAPAAAPAAPAKTSGASVWADEHRVGIAQGLDPGSGQGTRASFTGECSEVGMYLAMSRQADREATGGCRGLQAHCV